VLILIFSYLIGCVITFINVFKFELNFKYVLGSLVWPIYVPLYIILYFNPKTSSW